MFTEILFVKVKKGKQITHQEGSEFVNFGVF